MSSRHNFLARLASCASVTRFVFIAWCGAVWSSLGAAPATRPPEGTGSVIDHVWSGHPVSFALVTERGFQFVAYYDADRQLTVAGRKLTDDQWTRIHPSGTAVPGQSRESNVTGWDSHNYLSLALDRAGCLHLSGNMHANPLVYYRTRLPFDLSTLERIDRMTGERETRCTYPVFFKNSTGDLFFRYRDGSSGNGSDLYNRYDLESHTWHQVLSTPLLDGEGKRNAYALDPVLGPDGFFHLVWMWRDSPDCSTNRDLSYARSPDFVHWEDHRGRTLPLPITLETGDVIDRAKPGEGLINMTFNLGFTQTNQPVVVYHRYDDTHHSQIYAAKPGHDGAWEVRTVSAWNFCWAFSGNGSIAAEVMVGAPRVDKDGMLLIDYFSKAVGRGRWRVRPETLEVMGKLPPAPSLLPDALLKPESDLPWMEVQTAVSRDRGRRYVLRWETLSRNRDEPRDVVPPPTELRLYDVPDTDTDQAMRVGS